jgi:hypothetical protein
MLVTVSLVDNLPPSNFHMCVHMTCNERIKAKSRVYRPGPTVMCGFSTIIPLDQAPAVCPARHVRPKPNPLAHYAPGSRTS